MTCWIGFVPSPNALLLIYVTIGFFVNEAPRALIAKNKNNQSQEREATLRGPKFLPQV